MPDWVEEIGWYAWHCARIARAPKAHYRLLRVISYRDMVVAELQITNRENFPIWKSEVSAGRVPHLRDAGGHAWEPPLFDGCIHFVDYEYMRKLRVLPGETVTFWARISSLYGPLHRADEQAIPFEKLPQ
jgi:hypothetical protein